MKLPPFHDKYLQKTLPPLKILCVMHPRDTIRKSAVEVGSGSCLRRTIVKTEAPWPLSVNRDDRLIMMPNKYNFGGDTLS